MPLVLIATPAKAGLLVNIRNTFDFTLPFADDCFQEQLHLVADRHFLVTSMPRGQFNIHTNIKGTATGLESGNVWTYKVNTADVLPLDDGALGPLDGERFNYHVQSHVRFVGQRGVPSRSIRLSIKILIVNGEPVINELEFGGFCHVD